MTGRTSVLTPVKRKAGDIEYRDVAEVLGIAPYNAHRIMSMLYDTGAYEWVCIRSKVTNRPIKALREKSKLPTRVGTTP